MADLLGIASSGLGAIQQALRTTGNNIANVNTEGYSRQIADFSTLPSQRLGGHYFGSGVGIDAVRRAYDGFVADELRSRSGKLGFATAFESLASRADKLLGDSGSDLSQGMENFFNAIQGVASDPGSLSARQILLSDAQILTDRFTQLNNSLQGFERDANSRITSAVGEINVLSTNIAKLNSDIVLALGSGDLPNDLLDQRDALLMDLSEKAGISTIQQSNGAVNVFVGKGQPLVVDSTAHELIVTDNPLYPGRLEVAVAQPGGTAMLLSDQFKGGELQGIIDFRSRVLDPAISTLGRLAVGITDIMNTQHNLGVDLNGQLGGDLFTAINPLVIPSVNNSAAVPVATASLTLTNTSDLKASDYVLKFEGTQWQLTRTSDGASFNDPAGNFALDGISISVGGTPAVGDKFLLRPVHGAAEQFNLELVSPNQFAAAAPVVSSLSLANSGSAAVSNVAVSSTTGLPLAGPISLTFDANALGVGTPGYIVVGGPGGTLAFDPATESGGKDFTFPGSGGLSFTLSGIPSDGDNITLAANTGAVGDNRNALLLGNIQTQRLLSGNSATFGESYSGLVGGVGVATRRAEANLQVETNLMDTAVAARERISGVNLEQEAAELVRLQQAYQAAAQLVSISDTLFQTLLNAAGR